MIDTLDKNGKLALSKKQSGKLLRWARPDEFIANPNILEIIDCFSVKQTVVSDCSFVSSIIISAQYEKRFGKKIITKLIYPQNRKGNNVGLFRGRDNFAFFESPHNIFGLGTAVIMIDYTRLAVTIF